jgi:nucleoside-diphosphate-sugar epimerase
MWIAAAANELVVSGILRKTTILTRQKVPELIGPHMVVDSSRARRELGWDPRISLVQGFCDQVRWATEAGLL